MFDKLPAEEVVEALERLRDAETVCSYRDYEPDTTGRIMSRKFLALPSDTIWQGDTAWRLLKEVLGALINGSIAGLIVGALVFGASLVFPIERPHRLALSVLFSLICVTTIAAVVGASVPLILDKTGIDPAMATDVFITTSNDVLGVLVLFLMATAFYFWQVPGHSSRPASPSDCLGWRQLSLKGGCCNRVEMSLSGQSRKVTLALMGARPDRAETLNRSQPCRVGRAACSPVRSFGFVS